MINDLSPQNLEYLRLMMSGGEFPTVGAVLDAAVDALRRENEKLPKVPDAHMEAVEEALEEMATEGEEDFTQQDWDDLRQIVRDIAAKQSKAS